VLFCVSTFLPLRRYRHTLVPVSANLNALKKEKGAANGAFF